MNIQDFIKLKEEEFDEKFPPARDGDYTKHPLPHIKHFLSQSILEYNEKIKEMIEKIDALTPVVDKCMSKVSDEAKVPKYGQNYLGREDVLKLITNLTQDTNPKE